MTEHVSSELLRPDPKATALLVVDVQEKLSGTMPEVRLDDVHRALRIVLGAAREFSIPTIFTEQYPKGLGPTTGSLRKDLEEAGATRLEKNCFSAAAAEGFEGILPPGVGTVIVTGMEAHVCVFLTVRDLRARGLSVHVPMDGVVSRRDDHRQVGLDLCAKVGAVITTAETLSFDLLHRAGTPQFKAMARLIR